MSTVSMWETAGLRILLTWNTVRRTSANFVEEVRLLIISFTRLVITSFSTIGCEQTRLTKTQEIVSKVDSVKRE